MGYKKTGAGKTDNHRIRLAGIVEDSIVDGPGLRLVVFAQGCPHRCPGCHNPQTHSYEDGTWLTVDEIVQRYRRNPLLDGVTLSGGEPFEQAEGLARLARRIKALGGTVITYTGYTFEAIVAGSSSIPGWSRLLKATDWLIDGPFLLERKRLDLQYRGSDNQRIIDVSASIRHKAIVIVEMEK